MKLFCVKQIEARPHFLHESGSLNSWMGIYNYTNQNDESDPP